MANGRERLADWMTRSKVNQRQAARILDLDHTFLNQILSGRRVPALANAVKIERVTGIAVEAWLPTGDGNDDGPVLADSENTPAGKA